MLTFRIPVVAAVLSLAAVGAFAQVATAADPSTPRIDQREAHQQSRIARGAASGQLTPRETNRLEKQESRIDRTEARAKADGVVTRAERRHLTREQDRASRNIRRQKHDAQHA